VFGNTDIKKGFENGKCPLRTDEDFLHISLKCSEKKKWENFRVGNISLLMKS
jgi:hypothetical protein